MRQIKRLVGYIRPYGLRFSVSVILMAVVGACEALTALLIRPVFDSVLEPSAQSRPILLFRLPFHGPPVYLQDFLPSWIHNASTFLPIAIIPVTFAH